MKAEELLKNPDFEVELIRMVSDTTYDHPYPNMKLLRFLESQTQDFRIE